MAAVFGPIRAAVSRPKGQGRVWGLVVASDAMAGLNGLWLGAVGKNASAAITAARPHGRSHFRSPEQAPDQSLSRPAGRAPPGAYRDTNRCRTSALVGPKDI